MPGKRATKDITDIWRARIKKMHRGDLVADSIFENLLSDENNSSDSPAPDSDSTYNLEDDITPPVITPLNLSMYGSDETESSPEEVEIIDYIIPPYLFSLTRALNIEFNRCLLLDIESIPSTSAITDNNLPYPSYPLYSAKSSSSSESISSDSNKNRYRVTFVRQEHIPEDNESISTDCEVKTNRSCKSPISSSVESYETEEIIPRYFFVKSNLQYEEDSKATDRDVCDIPDTYASVSSVSLDPIAEIEADEIQTDQRLNTVESELHLENFFNMYSTSIDNEYSYKNSSHSEPIDEYNDPFNVIYLPSFENEFNETSLIEGYGNELEETVQNSSENESTEDTDSYNSKEIEYEKYSSEAYQ